MAYMDYIEYKGYIKQWEIVETVWELQDAGASDKDIYEYTYLYAYNFNKHFMAQSITEGAVVRYLFDMVTVSPIPSSPQEICLELVRDDSGDFLIKADTEISLACIRGYTEAIEHITDILGRNSVLN